MFHQVGPVGPFDAGTRLVTPSAELAPVADGSGDWAVIDHGELAVPGTARHVPGERAVEGRRVHDRGGASPARRRHALDAGRRRHVQRRPRPRGSTVRFDLALTRRPESQGGTRRRVPRGDTRRRDAVRLRGRLTPFGDRWTPSTIRFDGDVAIVTGAGHGLGRSYAVALAARGAAVVCNDVAPSAPRPRRTTIEEHGGRAVAETTSVATPAGGQAIVQAAIDAFGSVEIVVNNAGPAPQRRVRGDADRGVPGRDRHAPRGAFYVTQPAYRHMKEARYGRIVFTSSAAGMFGSPWQANYGAAKAGLVGLCNVVALEGAPLRDQGERDHADGADRHR